MFFDYRQVTQLDLNFVLFGIPIRVQPMFWLMSILLGWSYFQNTNDLSLLALWVIAVFISILLHELGHALTGQYFGAPSQIILHGFGGLAIGSTELTNRWQRLAVILAGPGVQLVLWGILLFLFKAQLFPQNSKAIIFLLMLTEINLYWPILNLIPVYPLDGGQALMEIITYFSYRGKRWTFGISAVVGIAAALYFGKTEQLFLVFLFILLVMQNIELYKQS